MKISKSDEKFEKNLIVEDLWPTMILPLVGVYFSSERKKSNLFFDHFFENTLPRYYSFCSEAISTPVEAEEKPEEVRVFLAKIQNLVEN